MHPPAPDRVFVVTLSPACLVLRPCAVACPPLCVRAQWPMPAWVWRDVRSLLFILLFISAYGPGLILAWSACLRLILFCMCPPLCVAALWLMPLWVWRDVRPVRGFFLVSTTDDAVEPMHIAMCRLHSCLHHIQVLLTVGQCWRVRCTCSNMHGPRGPCHRCCAL